MLTHIIFSSLCNSSSALTGTQHAAPAGCSVSDWVKRAYRRVQSPLRLPFDVRLHPTVANPTNKKSVLSFARWRYSRQRLDGSRHQHHPRTGKYVVRTPQQLKARRQNACNEMRLSTVTIALMAGYTRAFVVPGVAPRSSFVKPARAALSTLGSAASSSSSSPHMKIAIVTVR